MIQNTASDAEDMKLGDLSMFWSEKVEFVRGYVYKCMGHGGTAG